MKRVYAILTSTVIVFLTLTSLIYVVNFKNVQNPLAINGTIDLSTWDFTKQGPIQLRGEWAFYPDQLIFPIAGIDMFSNYEQRKKLNQIPKLWNLRDTSYNSDYTISTYRLSIQVPSDGKYALRTNSLRHANALFLNGVQVDDNRESLTNDDNDYMAMTKQIGTVQSDKGQIEVVVHVAKQYTLSKNFIQPIDFGLIEQISLKRSRNIVLDALQVSGFLILGLYYFGSSLQARKNNPQLFFGLFCLLQGFYSSTLNERVFQFFFTDIELTTLLTIQLFFLQASAMFFLLFTIRAFKEYTHKRTSIILVMLLFLSLLLLGSFQLKDLFISENPILLMEMLAVVAITISNLYIIIILIKTVQNNAESYYLVITATAYICYGLLFAVNFLYGVQIGYIHLFLFSVIAISLTLQSGYRFRLAYFQIDELTKDSVLHDQLTNKSMEKIALELKTSLHGILTASQQLMEGQAGSLKENQQRNVMGIHRIGERLTSILEDIAAVSESGNKEGALNPTFVDLHVIQETVEEITYLKRPFKEVSIRNEIDEKSPQVYVDERNLKDIVAHLLVNAIQFTMQGEIVIAAKVKGEHMFISVADTGIGIREEALVNIFKPFYQVESMDNRKSEGLGVGLTIAKQLVELSGGELSVTSEYGKGSCFTFTLPLSGNGIPEKAVKQATEKENDKRKFVRRVEGTRGFKILVVDAHHENLASLQKFISSLQFTVIAVDNGKEAIAVLEKETVDLLIIESFMPGMSGYEVCEVVRSEYNMIELPILILSSGIKSADLKSTMKAKANGFLQRPLSMAELKVKVESLVSIKQASQSAIHDELSYYYSQITPHFLFNTFNTIIALSYQSPEKVREALHHLTTYFRAKLDYYRYNTHISIKEEMELIKSYVAIEQLRYGEKLKVLYDIDDTIQARLPSMTIQPLVENAIQHGIHKGGQLFISIQRDMGNVVIIVEDDGIGMSEEKVQSLLNENGETAGIGFVNSFRKLQLVKGTQFQLESKEGKGTKVTIILPGGKEDEGSYH